MQARVMDALHASQLYKVALDENRHRIKVYVYSSCAAYIARGSKLTQVKT